ncbi:response regulator transcription factor [Leucobacter sp. cx-328]|uniref:response regulator n=1 Tax=unclassified Leucobacter TaxID=2621730 RepID=UPI00165DA197|nr:MULTISPECIES: response regulator transcription factor [unclassified Leucobacter]MBC9945111.1 response regulator transcription factor [Leucobacter sp. cx-328]
MIRVLVVDDQSLIRQAVVDILASEDDIDVVGEATNGEEALALAAELDPDVVLMDIRMPKLDGISATAALCEGAAGAGGTGGASAVGAGDSDSDRAGTRVLILTTFEEDENVVAALRAGASGFLGKGAEPEEIVRAVQAVHAGDALLSPAATRSLIARYVAAPAAPAVDEAAHPELATLTEREREVLLLVARGKSNQEIADELFISPHTAKTHVNRIMMKVFAHDRAQLVILAYESGLLVPGLGG